jgi:hypothetical protein
LSHQAILKLFAARGSIELERRRLERERSAAPTASPAASKSLQ